MPPDSPILSSAVAIKRTRQPLPSLVLNLVRALALLIICSGLLLAWVQYGGNPNDAVAEGHVDLEPLPLPEISDSLNGDSAALPDLLDGLVPKDENPTEILDALGNPVQNRSEVTMAGGQPIAPIQSVPINSPGQNNPN